jgi:hypothetical protein
MEAALRQQIEQALWPAGGAAASVWAVLDLARDRRIHAALLESRLEYLCLYSGRLPRELELAAPHMVELLPGHRLLDRLFGEGWVRHWGVFVRIGDPTQLRRHLRKLLRVRDEEGRRLLLRFYDPRVLGPFLRSCDAEQLRTFFGPVGHWLARDPIDGALVEYRIERGTLQERVATVPARPATVTALR